MNSGEDDGGGGGGPEPQEGVRQRKGSMGRNSSQDNRDSEPREKDYTDEQVTAVKRLVLFELRGEKTGFRDFQSGLTQSGLCSHRSRLEASNFRF